MPTTSAFGSFASAERVSEESVMDEQEMEKLSGLRDALVVPLSQTDAEKWPIRSGRVVKLVAREMAEEFFGDLDRLRAQGWSDQRLAGLFEHPSRLWRFAHHLLNGVRAADASIADQRRAMIELVALIEQLKVGSPFCETGANVVIDDEEVLELCDELAQEEEIADPAAAHRCAATLWSCAEAMYFVAHELGVEIHGPYSLPDGGKLLIRDFFSLQPTELWPEARNEHLDFELLRIAVIYRRFDGWFDVYNNLYLEPSFALVPESSVVAAWRDGERLATEDLEGLCREGSTTIRTVAGMVESWSLEEVARKYAEVLWWRKRELALAARGEWRPDPSLLARFTEDALPPPAARNPTVEALRRDFDLTLEPA
jgi:hypothetical protein